MSEAPAIHIYTDGSSVGNVAGPGGWAAVIYLDPKQGVEPSHTVSGYETDTTNQRMEIRAAIEGLDAVSGVSLEGSITVYSDSSYLINCMRRRWHETWAKKGWLNHRKKPVANRDLWERLLAVLKTFESCGVAVEFRKVKGHTKATHAHAEGNRRADFLAVAAKEEGMTDRGED